MLRALRSELVKLRRKSMLLWGLGGGLFVGALATAITIERAQQTPGMSAGMRFHLTVAQLSQPDGLVHGVLDVSNLVGVIALALFAGSVASEYSQGTLRNLLLRQPRRMQLLSGKFLALACLFFVSVICAISVAAGVAFALGPSKGIDTSAWTTSTGLSDLAQAIFHLYLASVGFGILGTALAVVVRSPAVAIAVGIAYALPGEAIITRLWENGDQWLPAQLLNALANGGTSSVSYSRALIILSVYAVVAAIGALALFQRRDV